MKLGFATALLSSLLFNLNADAFTVSAGNRGFIPISTATTALASTAESAPPAAVTKAFEQPSRVIRDQLPIVYVYDHCPFCVRARLALGMKNVKHNIFFLANDDIPTPTALVGKKVAPIFVRIIGIFRYFVLLGALIVLLRYFLRFTVSS